MMALHWAAPPGIRVEPAEAEPVVASRLCLRFHHLENHCNRLHRMMVEVDLRTG